MQNKPSLMNSSPVMESTPPAKSSRPARNFAIRSVAAILLITLAVGCAAKKETVKVRASAREMFDETVKNYHLPSAQAQGDERERLLREAAAGYTAILRAYADQPYWGAQALRSLGNIRAAEEKAEEAVRLYAEV